MPHLPETRRPPTLRSLFGRAALVAGSTTTAALLVAVPVAPTAPPAPAPHAAAVTSAPVVPLAVARTTAVRFDSASTTAAPAARRTSALHKAMGKIGAKYRYGAAGPNAFDCSGLVTWAYRGSGTNLPRSSRAMSHVGTPVSRSALQPGDLVFFYRGPSHVGIYVGNGKVVHASNPAQPVKLADMSTMPFNSARRV